MKSVLPFSVPMMYPYTLVHLRFEKFPIIEHFYLFNPRPFVVCDPATSAKDNPERADANIRELIVKSGVTHLVVDDPNEIFGRLSQRCGQSVAGPTQLRFATRNPFNSKYKQIQVFRLHDCGAR